jgi:hypothetical protein
MNKLQRFGLVGASVTALVGIGIGPASAAVNTTQVVVNVRTTHVCMSESETETVYRHKVNGAYVAYPTPKVEHTASLNHKTVCHDTRTVKYAS